MLSLASSGTVYAYACTSAASSNWNSTATWTNCGGGVPGSGDSVAILSSHAVTTNASTNAASLTINSGGTLNVAGFNLTIGGATSVTGTLNITSATGTKTFSDNVTINSGGTWKESANEAITFGGSLQNDGTFTANTGVHTFSGAAKTFSGANPIVVPSVTVAGTYQNNGTLTVNTLLAGAGTLTNGATGTLNLGNTTTITTLIATADGNTVNYTHAGTQTVKSTSYHNLGLSNSGAKTMTGITTIGGDLSISGTATMTNNAAFTVAGALNYTSTGSTGLSTAISIGSFNLAAGTFDDNGKTITVTGTGANTWSMTGGTFTASGTVALTGAAPQIGASNFYNLTVNVGVGNSTTLTGNATLSNNLTMTTGLMFTGNNYLVINKSSCLTAISYTTTSYVVGNLRMNYPTGTTTCTFPIGDVTAYTPVTVAMNSVSVSGTLTAHTDTPDHADTTSGVSGIDGAKSVNRTWTLTPGGSLAFSTYNPTFNFVAGDIDSGATTSSFIIGRKSASWSYPTISVAQGTYTTATGLSAFGEFAIGEPAGISGTVFEDTNYGGGAGRDMTTSAGTAITGVRMELYGNTGVFLSSTTTNAGAYSFKPLASGTYTVRVASNGATGIRSTRTGGAACSTCVPVQTYHTNSAGGTAVAVTDHVGGETPTLLDAGDNTTSATLASLTTGTTTAQSIATVAKGSSNVTGVDFGFNFDSIVSIRDSGQGSLRQFIVNANALGGEGSLAAGRETSLFMIPNGQANPGQNTGYANQLATSGANAGAAVITLTTGVLPTISDANTSLDATTQTSNVGDTNAGTVGTGGTVGTMAQTLPRFNRPEVVIAAAATQLIATGTTVTIKGLAVANGGISAAGSGSQVRDCLAGMNADGTVTTTYGGTYGIVAGAGTNILISHNYVKVNNSGIRGESPGSNLTIEYNEVDSPQGTPGGGQNATIDGILIVNSATNVTVQYNLSKNQYGGGLEFGFGTGVVTGLALGNTIMGNGFNGATPSTEPLGIATYSLASGTSIIIRQNIVTGNAGPGIAVVPSAAQNTSGITITQNSVYANGTLGIDLNSNTVDPNGYLANGVTLNDLNDADTGPNGLLNYPVIESATISGGNLILKGWARPGSAIEFFIAAPDANGFGEGKTYLTTLSEGSGADTDATSSTYGPGAINGIAQGTDTTNRFQFTIPLPGGVASGTVLTSTATVATNTSGFSGNVTVAALPNLTVLKTAFGATSGISAKPGQDIPYQITVTNTGYGKAWEVNVTDAMSVYTAFKLSTLTFIDGGISSGLSMGTINYSYDNGATWTTTTPADLGGGYNGTVTNWKVVFNPLVQMNANNAFFTISYQLKVK